MNIRNIQKISKLTTFDKRWVFETDTKIIENILLLHNNYEILTFTVIEINTKLLPLFILYKAIFFSMNSEKLVASPDLSLIHI